MSAQTKSQPSLKINSSIAARCRDLNAAVDALSALGVIVRKVELHGHTLPLVWVWYTPKLYRSMGQIDGLGRNAMNGVKSCPLAGCEVRWLEPLSLRPRWHGRG